MFQNPAGQTRKGSKIYLRPASHKSVYPLKTVYKLNLTSFPRLHRSSRSSCRGQTVTGSTQPREAKIPFSRMVKELQLQEVVDEKYVNYPPGQEKGHPEALSENSVVLILYLDAHPSCRSPSRNGFRMAARKKPDKMSAWARSDFGMSAKRWDEIWLAAGSRSVRSMFSEGSKGLIKLSLGHPGYLGTGLDFFLVDRTVVRCIFTFSIVGN